MTRPDSLEDPARQGSVLSLYRDVDVVRLLVRAYQRGRYRDSLLGAVWSFAPPLMRFAVYFFVIGLVLGLVRRVENFPIYIFSGLVVTSFFTTSIAGLTRCLLPRRRMLAQLHVPAEVFPVSALATLVIRLGPPLLILLAAAVVTGWRFDAQGMLYGVAGLVLLTSFLLGLGLITSAGNLFYRDVQHGVTTLSALVFWSSPVLYPVSLVEEALGDGVLLQLYLANPVTLGVIGMREAFWEPTVDTSLAMPDLTVPIAAGVSLTVATLVLGQLLFNHLESRFGEVA